MSKIRRIRIKPKRNSAASSLSGAALTERETTVSRITLYSYNSESYFVNFVSNALQLKLLLKENKSLTHWIDFRGEVKHEFLEFFELEFNIHKLVTDDITHTYQRPKLDEYNDYLFATSRMLYVNPELEIENEQISFLLMPKILVSFQVDCTDCIDRVIPILEQGKGIIRTGGTSYMMYSLMDAVIDNYCTLIFKLGDELETIEELLYRKPDKSIMFKIQDIKRAMIMVRRAAWPERDKLNDMLRSESSLIHFETKTFLKDAYDHCMQLIDLVESYKDITTSLIDMNLSIVSNRMNEIMKVLTIISSIFIPLTFIAGVYGMNFAYQDPKTGNVLHNNMPELYAENGYVYTIVAMFFISVLQIIWFWRKGWLKS